MSALQSRGGPCVHPVELIVPNEQRQKIIKKKTGLYIIFGGIGTLGLGYFLLGQGSMNAAPILIIGAFVIMAVGILVGWD